MCGWEAPLLSPGFPVPPPPEETTRKVSTGICDHLKLCGGPRNFPQGGNRRQRAVTEVSAAGVRSYRGAQQRPLSAALGTARTYRLVLGLGVHAGVYVLFMRRRGGSV